MADPMPQDLLSALVARMEPTPVQTFVLHAKTGAGLDLVALVIETVQGNQGFFISPDHAQELSDALANAARGARTGLTIIGNGQGAPE